MAAIVHGADIQDSAGGVLLMATVFGLYPFLLKLYADAGYQGPKFQNGLARVCRTVKVEIVRRCDTEKFVILPKRWIVERTIAWLNRCRRLSKDWECLNQNARAFLRWASFRLMLRRACKERKGSGTDTKAGAAALGGCGLCPAPCCHSAVTGWQRPVICRPH